MTNKQFYTVWGDALEDDNRDAFISDWSLSALFLDPEDPSADLPAGLPDQLGAIWDAAHMDLKAIRATTGLTQIQFAEWMCVGRRTVENWEARGCPQYIRLMLLQLLGILSR